MTIEPPEIDPKLIWQNQRMENPSMSIQAVQEKTNKLEMRYRLAYIIGGVVLIGFAAVWLIGTLGGVEVVKPWIDIARFVFWAVLLLAFPFFQDPYYRRPMSIVPQSAQTQVEFYRRELERRREHFRTTKYTSIILMPVMVRAVLGSIRQMSENPVQALNLIFLCALVLVVVVAFFLTRRRELQFLEHEIRQLN